MITVKKEVEITITGEDVHTLIDACEIVRQRLAAKGATHVGLTESEYRKMEAFIG